MGLAKHLCLNGKRRQAACGRVCGQCSVSADGVERLTNLRLQDFNFKRQTIKLCQLARQKSDSQASFFDNTGWGKQVVVGQFVWTFAKALHFDEAFTKQCFQAIVGFTQTDAQCASKVALAQVRVRLQKA